MNPYFNSEVLSPLWFAFIFKSVQLFHLPWLWWHLMIAKLVLNCP